MENEKRKMENEERESNRGQFSTFNFPLSFEKVCAACGTQARRETAKFCLVCGKHLLEDYEPLDTIRSSYRLQGQSFLIENAKKVEITNLFERSENSVSQTAWACVVYSFVPYLGILFVPLAFLVGGFGYFVSYRQPHLGGRKLALVCVGLSFVVLIVQIFLWWLLYIIPELGKQI
ncbi:MAG: hypothetical protein LC778_17225 [Acidobacteria bacterium]|nr:hypothetical protein [Acidobacteriota bacterium]